MMHLMRRHHRHIVWWWCDHWYASWSSPWWRMNSNGHELAHLNSDLNFRSLGNRRRVANPKPCQRFKETPQCKSSFIINHQEFSWNTTTNNLRFQEDPFYTDMKPLWAFTPLWWFSESWCNNASPFDCWVGVMIPGKTQHKDEIFLNNPETSLWLIQLEVKLWNVTASPFLPQTLVVWRRHLWRTDATTQRWIHPRSFDQCKTYYGID